MFVDVSKDTINRVVGDLVEEASRYVPQLYRTKGRLAGDIIITNQCTCHGLGGVQASVLLLTTQQTRHNHISTLYMTTML